MPRTQRPFVAAVYPNAVPEASDTSIYNEREEGIGALPLASVRPPPPTMPIRIDPEPLHLGTKYGDFRDQLVNDGFAVVPRVIPADKAADYVQQCYDWLESFELGFKR